MTVDSAVFPEPVSHPFASQGLTLRYVDWGNAGAPLLLLLHGNRDHARSWDRVAAELRDAWHVVALDLRGHGDSDWSPDGAYLSSYHLLDVLNLLDALGAERAAIVGHSFGGNIAARLAGAFPERVTKLALVDGFGPPPSAYEERAKAGPARRTRGWVEQWRAAAGRPAKVFASVDEAAGRLRAGNPLLPEAQAGALALHGLKPVEGGFAWKCDPVVSLFAPEDFAADNAAELWGAVACPTLLCFGAESWNKSPEADGRAGLLADYRVAPIAGAGHWPHHDRLDAFMAALRDFLEG